MPHRHRFPLIACATSARVGCGLCFHSAAHVITTLTGSALIALAVVNGRLTAEEAWRAAHVDEDFNRDTWGQDEIAMARRAFRFAELQAAAAVLAALA